MKQRNCRVGLALWSAIGLYLWVVMPGEQIHGFWLNVAYWGVWGVLS